MSDAFWIALPGSIAAVVGAYNIYETNKSKKQSVANASAIKEVKNSVIEVHDSVNGKMQQLLDVTASSSKAEGKLEEKADQSEREEKK